MTGIFIGDEKVRFGCGVIGSGGGWLLITNGTRT